MPRFPISLLNQGIFLPSSYHMSNISGILSLFVYPIKDKKETPRGMNPAEWNESEPSRIADIIYTKTGFWETFSSVFFVVSFGVLFHFYGPLESNYSISS